MERRLLAGLRFAGIVLALALILFVRAYHASRAGDAYHAGRAERGRQARIATSAVAALRTLRGFGVLFACLAIYEALHDLTPVLRPHVDDQWLVDSDHFFFHADVGRWLNDHIASAFATHVLTYCYVSYAFASPIYAGYQYVKANYREFHDFALAITVTAFIGYSGYLLIPAVGPYLFQHDLYADPLKGWAAGGILDIIAKMKGSARDAFPSLHTAMTTVVLVSMWRHTRRLFWIYLPVGLGLYLATMYLRVHYATDVAAGLAVAGFALFVAPKINKWWYGRNARAMAVFPRTARVPRPRQAETVSA